VVGGAPIANQIYRLKSGIQIMIATPERLLDMLAEHCELSLYCGPANCVLVTKISLTKYLHNCLICPDYDNFGWHE